MILVSILFLSLTLQYKAKRPNNSAFDMAYI